jgi:hypothetical protein
MAADKKMIDITSGNELVLARMVEAGRFASELDAAKFAMAYAINRETPAGSTDGAATKWNVGSVDPDGSLRSLIEALFPAASEPYRLVEHLMNEGLRLLDTGSGPPADVVDILFGSVAQAPSRASSDTRDGVAS